MATQPRDGAEPAAPRQERNGRVELLADLDRPGSWMLLVDGISQSHVDLDDPRHLDWRVFGKSDRFYIKQFEEETNLRAHILLDCSSSMRYPDHDARPLSFWSS